MMFSRIVPSSRGRPIVSVKALLLLAIVCISVVAPAVAEDRYIPVGQPDGRVLLPPPPKQDSPEALADLALARVVFKGRTPEEEARAIKSASLAFTLFSPAVGPGFDLSKLPKAEALLEKVKKEVAETINVPKDEWKRLRPYQADSALQFGRPERSYGYPSGHSTRGMLYALIVAELFPEKKEAVLEVGRLIGWDRVLIGKHYATDIFAGRVLAMATMREMLANPTFQRDLAAAKEEIQARKAELQGAQK